MVEKSILIISLLFVFENGFSQSEDSLVESFSTFTVYLENKSPVLKGGILVSQIDYGSGFFVEYNNYMYLVTAKHVAKKINSGATITFYSINSSPSIIKIDSLVNEKVEWTFNEKADVAVLPIKPTSILFRDTLFQAMPLNFFYDTLVAPLRRLEIILLGFPLRLGIEKFFSPISTSTKTASRLIDLKNPETDSLETFFLVDAPSIPGNSGGPAMTIPVLPSVRGYFYGVRDSLSCVGLVSGVIGNFAAIVPSKFIVETIKKTPRFSGRLKFYHSNGKIWTEREYENGFIKEVLYNLDKTGKPQDKGTIKNGSGTVNYYTEDGRLYVIEVYENGKVKEVKKL